MLQVACVFMLWLILISLVVVTVLYVMLAPIAFIIDTDRAWYGVRILYLADARVLVRDAEFMYRVDVLWWHREASVRSLFTATTTHKKAKKKSSKVTKKRTFALRQLKSVLRAIRVRHCQVLVDTGNQQLNGMLFPIASEIARWSGRDVAINFQDIVRVHIELRCTLARLGASLLRSRINRWS